jgi:3-hydroxybutyryl-CoA dehydrogenase
MKTKGIPIGGKMTEDDKNAVLGRIKPSTSLKDMASADFVVEAAI